MKKACVERGSTGVGPISVASEIRSKNIFMNILLDAAEDPGDDTDTTILDRALQ